MFKIKAIKATTIALALAGVFIFTASPSQAALGDQVLQNGIVHEDVKELQLELKILGFLDIENVTTNFGSATEDAVKSFQNSKGVEANGIFDKTTYELLLASIEVIELTTEVDPKAINSLTFDGELTLESKGDDVRLLQEALKGLGYLDIENCTDYFGDKTEEALKVFQQKQELRPDGIAGLRTIDAINLVLRGRGITLPSANRSAGIGTIASNIATTAKNFLGSRYVYGGSSPKGFDCSGFTTYVYKQFGISLPRSSSGQASAGTKIDKGELQIGDLLIFSNTYKSGPSHSGVYLGNGQFIHASTTTTGVIISDLNSSYYTKHFSYGRRLY